LHKRGFKKSKKGRIYKDYQDFLILLHFGERNLLLEALVISRKLIPELDRKGSDVIWTEKAMKKILSCKTVKEENRLEVFRDFEKIWEKKDDIT